jgi:hypothetical protein
MSRAGHPSRNHVDGPASGLAVFGRRVCGPRSDLRCTEARGTLRLQRQGGLCRRVQPDANTRVDGKPIAPGRVTCPLPPWDAAFPGAFFSCLKTIRKRITPQQVLFTLLSVYPGTEEFELLRAEKIFDEETFFTQPEKPGPL